MLRSGGGVVVSDGGLSPPALDAEIALDNRVRTTDEETTPLATIKQRNFFSESNDEGDAKEQQRPGAGEGVGQADEGHEFTLEEHQSSM